jgi:hypothetical protein
LGCGKLPRYEAFIGEENMQTRIWQPALSLVLIATALFGQTALESRIQRVEKR